MSNVNQQPQEVSFRVDVPGKYAIVSGHLLEKMIWDLLNGFDPNAAYGTSGTSLTQRVQPVRIEDIHISLVAKVVEPVIRWINL